MEYSIYFSGLVTVEAENADDALVQFSAFNKNDLVKNIRVDLIEEPQEVEIEEEES